MFTLFVILAVFLQIAIALGVYFRRHGGHTNTVFMYLTLSLASWALANYVAITVPQNQNTVYAIRIVIGLAVVQNTLFYFFAQGFPDKRISQVRYGKAVLIYSLLLLILTQSPLLFQSVTIKGGTANPNPGPAMLFFVVHAAFTIVSGLHSLLHKYRGAVGQAKRQLMLVIFASTVLWFVVPITNFIITLTAHTTVFVRFSPFYTLLFGAFITYAIVAQKLFDIRAAVARSVGYVLVLGAAALIYSLVFFGVINVFFPGTQHEFLRQLLAIFLVAPLALAFQGLKTFFDRWTNKLFYRESYDPQEVLDKIGNIVVAEIDLFRILNHTRSVLSDALKSSFIEFIVLKNGVPHVEAHRTRRIDQDTLALGADIVHQKMDLLVADDISSQTGLPHRLREADAALSLRLKTHEQVVGYVIFGDKKSGDVYTAPDRKLLLILANELVIAVQNALRFEEIENFNLTLQAKVDEATKKLRQANEKLRQLDETKDDFISMASHQLRTPLTSVKGYTSMVLEGDAGKIQPSRKNARPVLFQRPADGLSDS